ncbi:MAG: hypothetical protein LC650_01930 [Actinobacteria bacterium]|nr:hypothetical protein [Actinomycetota bacterium]
MTWMDTYGPLTIFLVCAGWVGTLAIVFLTGVGRRVLKRIKQQWLYKRGGYVNSIMVFNNGVANELFVKKDTDGSFKVGEGKYVADRKKTILLDGIPTQVNIEGIAEPVDVAGYDTSDKMSTAELVQVIDNNNANDFLGLLKTFQPYALIIAVGVAALILASLYFGWQSYDMLQRLGVEPAQLMGGGR